MFPGVSLPVPRMACWAEVCSLGGPGETLLGPLDITCSDYLLWQTPRNNFRVQVDGIHIFHSRFRLKSLHRCHSRIIPSANHRDLIVSELAPSLPPGDCSHAGDLSRIIDACPSIVLRSKLPFISIEQKTATRSSFSLLKYTKHVFSPKISPL
jgi:hypothetical protein